MTSSGGCDVHSHTIPASVLAGPGPGDAEWMPRLRESDGITRLELAGGAVTPPVVGALVEDDLSSRVEAMDKMGIRLQVLSPWVNMSASFVRDDLCLIYARNLNQRIASLGSQFPGRFHCMGTVPLQYPDQAAEELAYAVDQLGMIGVQIPAMVPPDPAEEWAAFWRAAEQLECVIIIHPLALSLASERYMLGNFVGNPAESTLAIARILFSGVMGLYPSLRIVVVHGGGFLPYQLGRLEHGLRVYGSSLGARLGESLVAHARRLYYDSLVHSPVIARTLIDVVGVEQVLLGTDFPFPMGDREPVENLDRVGALTAEDRRRVLFENYEDLTRPVLSRRQRARV
jgi:aminocarboxymuconate-semialdehyde decarboxylase